MAHEIGTFDRVAVTQASKRGAFDTADGWDWHGLARRMPQEHMTKDEAREAAGLNWRLIETGAVSGVVEFAGEAAPVRVIDDQAKILVREDTREVFGTVGAGFSVVQPFELFDVAEAIRDADSTLKIESVGSTNNGRYLFASIRGDSFEVCRGDTNTHYLTVILGMAGQAAWHHVPMAYRTLCKNGIRATLAQGRRNAATVSIRHSGDMAQKIKSAQAIVANWRDAQKGFEAHAAKLAAASITGDQADKYFAKVIEDLELGRKIPTAADSYSDKAKRRDRERAVDALRDMRSTLLREAETLGTPANAWLLANAATRFFDWTRDYRGADNKARREARIASITWGEKADAKVRAFTLAAELVGIG